jgi:predicted amidohydrolase
LFYQPVLLGNDLETETITILDPRMKDIRIAAVVAHAPLCRTQENLDRTALWIKAAKKQGAELICFPELHLSGYAVNDCLREAAQPIPGPLTDALVKMSVDADMVVLAGMAEIDETARMYATHVVVTPDGKLQRYRKTHVAPPEKAIFSRGNEIPVFQIEKLTFGIQLCYDAHFPEISTQMTLQRADVIFIPHASPRGSSEDKLNSWSRHLTARAFDNGIFVVACNQIGDNGGGLQFPGLAVAVGPDGRVMEELTTENEALLVVDLLADRLAYVRNHAMRYFFPNRRPGLYNPS